MRWHHSTACPALQIKPVACTWRRQTALAKLFHRLIFRRVKKCMQAREHITTGCFAEDHVHMTVIIQHFYPDLLTRVIFRLELAVKSLPRTLTDTQSCQLVCGVS